MHDPSCLFLLVAHVNNSMHEQLLYIWPEKDQCDPP